MVTARDDLLPLISTELAILNGKNTEGKSLELTKNLFNLFKSLLEKNVEATNNNISLLQNSDISAETLNVLSNDINLYLQSLSATVEVPETEKTKTLKKETD